MNGQFSIGNVAFGDLYHGSPGRRVKALDIANPAAPARTSLERCLRNGRYRRPLVRRLGLPSQSVEVQPVASAPNILQNEPLLSGFVGNFGHDDDVGCL